ncbi:MAG: SAM-dependent methyltransferase [Myxococcota bacterium]|jgi:SAM-dependent methyltransferase
MLWLDDLARMRCPRSDGPLRWGGLSVRDGVGERLVEGELRGPDASWPVRGGLAELYRDADLTGTDRLLRRIYDTLPGLHDPAVEHTLPLFQSGGTEAELRAGIMDLLELAEDRPLRILEVGVGTGANLPWLVDRAAHPPELWALDASRGMLARADARIARNGLHVRTLLGDAHRLPFADASFDRAFHVGGINGFSDPAAALAELARVVVPGAPIVVVDEQLDPTRAHSWWNRLTFRAVTFYDHSPEAPVRHLPPDATDVDVVQLSRFFYGLRFRRR